MPSNLLNLLRYARSEKIDSKENFTTEALAACIRYDPRPLLNVLKARSWFDPAGDVEVTPHTQVRVPGVGCIDLVVELRVGDEVTTFWIEVKVDAGEHGPQINNYLDCLAGRPRMMLLTMGKHPLRPDVAHVTWREVRRAALGCEDSSNWRDFVAFLEDIEMADAFDEPISGDEFASFGRAYALLRKMAHVLEPVGKHANAVWAHSGWPEDEEQIQKTLGAQFAKYRRFTIENGTRVGPVWVHAGVWEDPKSSHGVIRVSVAAKPKDLATRAALSVFAQKLPHVWEWPKGGWSVIAASLVPTGGELEKVTKWFTGRLDELLAAGVFDRIDELSNTSRQDPAIDAESESVT